MDSGLEGSKQTLKTKQAAACKVQEEEVWIGPDWQPNNEEGGGKGLTGDSGLL